MSVSKKTAMAAVCTALAVICLVLSRYIGVISLTPLLLASLCLCLSFKGGIAYGLLSIAATITLAFFLTGGINSIFIITACYFAPYSALAWVIKKRDYKKIKDAVLRILCTAALFNLALAVFAFVLADFIVAEVLFGYNMQGLLNLFADKGGYIVLALLGSALAVATDFLFVIAYKEITKNIKLFK